MGCTAYRPNVLMHTGKSKLDGAKIGSGRYPLGSGERPNQHRGGIFSKLFKPKNEKHFDKKKQKKKHHGMSEEEKDKQFEAEKSRIQQHGDVKAAYKHRNEMSYNELNNAYNKYGMHKRLKEAQDELKKDQSKLDKVIKLIDKYNKTSDVLQKGIKTTNKWIKIFGGLVDDEDESKSKSKSNKRH